MLTSVCVQTICVKVHVHSRSGCSNDSAFLLTGMKTQLGWEWGELRPASRWEEKEGNNDNRGKHIGQHLFITPSPSVQPSRGSNETDDMGAPKSLRIRSYKKIKKTLTASHL